MDSKPIMYTIGKPNLQYRSTFAARLILSRKRNSLTDRFSTTVTTIIANENANTPSRKVSSAIFGRPRRWQTGTL